MPELDYRLSGPQDAPLVVLAGSLASSLEMWQPQLAGLEQTHRVLRFSYPGHGQSGGVAGDGSVADLADGVLALVDRLGVERFSVVGLSLGGITGLHLAATQPRRVERLVVSCCRYYQEPEMRKAWDNRIGAVLAKGMEPVVEPTLERWLGSRYREDNPEPVARIRAMIAATTPQGFAHCAAAVRDFDGRELAGRIAVPVLVLSGANDEAAPGAHMRELAQALPNARHHELPGSHLLNVECAADYTRLVGEFLA